MRDRVVARFLVEAEAIGDPKSLLLPLWVASDKIDRLEPSSRKLLGLLGDMERADGANEPWEVNRLQGVWSTLSGEVATLRYGVEKLFLAFRDHMQTLFLAILQQYAVPPNKVRKVQEAARFWSKSRIVLRRDKRPWAPRHSEAVVAFSDFASTFREHLALASDIVGSCKLHGTLETPKLKAGPFTLVNTGNFKPEVMERVRDVAEKAADAMTRVGLGKVCYGDILVTNTITSKGTVAAFYMLASDEMFVRANVKPGWDTAKTICHELAHRLENKFLQGKRSDIAALYRQIDNHNWMARPTGDYPEVGRTVEFKGDKLVVLDVNRYRDKIQFGEPPAPGVRSRKIYTAPLEWWAKNIEGKELERGPDFKGFITPYAQKGGASENFAEMVAYYALGKLPQGLVELLEPILK